MEVPINPERVAQWLEQLQGWRRTRVRIPSLSPILLAPFFQFLRHMEFLLILHQGAGRGFESHLRLACPVVVAQLVEQLSILFAAFPFQRSIGRSYYRPLGQLPVKQTTYDPLLLFWGNAALCGEHQGVNETASDFPHKGKTRHKTWVPMNRRAEAPHQCIKCLYPPPQYLLGHMVFLLFDC